MTPAAILRQRSVLGAVILLVGAGASGCGGTGSADAAVTRTVVTTEMRFAPARITAGANRRVVVVVDNTGEVAHTFSINELNVEVKVNPGEARRVTVDAPAATYQYVCRILDHEGLGMVGQLVLT